MSNYKNIESEQLVDIFKALANNHRLKIYDILTNCCTPGTNCATDEVFSCCVGDLADCRLLCPILGRVGVRSLVAAV